MPYAGRDPDSRPFLSFHCRLESAGCNTPTRHPVLPPKAPELSLPTRAYTDRMGLGQLIGYVSYPQKDNRGFYLLSNKIFISCWYKYIYLFVFDFVLDRLY